MAWLWPLGLLLMVLSLGYASTPPPSKPRNREDEP